MELTQEARISAPILQEIKREFDRGHAVDPGTIGHHYESELSRQKDRQRASGSFFTPSYLVDFVVQQTLAPVVSGLGLNEILSLRILDPSCGGGAFLLGVLRFLEALCIQRGAKEGSQLREQICHRCLVGVDLDPNAVEVTRGALRLAIGDSSTRSIQLQVGDALLPETDVGVIDAIVGNPPWGQKGLRLSPEQKSRYKACFATAVGVWDPFKLFVERCHQLLPAGRRWGLVLPDIVLLKNLQEVRDVILGGSEIDEIAHCGRAFAHVNIDAVAIVATRRDESSRNEEHAIRVWPSLPPSWKTASVTTHQQEQRVFRELPGHAFNLYLHGDALNLYRRLRPYPRLGDRFEMHEGVHTGNSRKKLFSKKRAHSTSRKVVVGRKEFGPYRIRWGGTWLDTRKSAIDRKAGAYANLGQSRWHGPHKIVVRRTGDRVLAAYDHQGYYVSNNLFVLLPMGEMPIQERKAIVALLNSRFMTWYFRAIQPRKGRLFAELKLVHLRDLPMPIGANWDRIVASLAELSEQACEENSEAIARRVDALVESAYEVSRRELGVITCATS